MIKIIKSFFHYLVDTTLNGFYFICLIFSKGFFFYFYLISLLFEKIFRLKVFKNLKNYFKNKQTDSVAFLTVVFVFLLGVFVYTYFYTDNSEIKYVDDGILDKKPEQRRIDAIASDKETYTDKEINLYRKYGKMDIHNIDFNELKKTNPEVVAWITVDGTNVNYPVVQANDNDYYLNHDIVKGPKGSGWPFMDYRNSIDLSDNNTIFYGHNLLNKTAFGSLSNVFTKKWFSKSNHYILVATESGISVYQIFSCYYIDPEVYYLQNNFYNTSDYQEFLNKLKSRSNFNFGLDVTTDDKIITLSTCTDDNKGRKVIHAKRIG